MSIAEVGAFRTERGHEAPRPSLSQQTPAVGAVTRAVSRSTTAALRRLVDEVLEVPDIRGLTQLLTRSLPEALGIPSVDLLMWNRKLDSFETLSPLETHGHAIRPGETWAAVSDPRFVLADGALLETPGGKGEGVLVPLLARSGLVGMLVLGIRSGWRKSPYRPAEVRLISTLAARSALAMENHIYQKELIVTERMAAIGAMAGMLAHDFRGPMTVIRGYAETLIDPELDQDEVASRAGIIMQMIDRLERMTGETLDIARGEGHLVRREVPVTLVLDELAAAIEVELPGLAVRRDFDVPTAARALLDVDKLRRAVDNIAANARDAMGGRGRLDLKAFIEDGRLVLIVADEGPGIPAEIKERVFEPFVTKGKKNGTGLGLAVSKRFVEEHGGTIALDDGGPGARFRITLPLRETVAPILEG